jgi:hypothetical protein
MNRWFKIFQTAILAASSIVVFGCAETDDDKIGDAQFCMDDIPVSGLSVTQRTSRVNECVSKLGTLQSAKASMIRCSANFLIEGFGDPERIMQAFDAISSGSQSGSSGTVAMMNQLKFSSQATAQDNSAFAEETVQYCKEAGNPGYILVSSFSRIATTLSESADILADGQLTPTEISNLATQTPEVIGQTAEIAYQTSCSGNQPSNDQLCTELGAAMASGATSTEIGQALLSAWQNQ